MTGGAGLFGRQIVAALAFLNGFAKWPQMPAIRPDTRHG